MAKSIVVVTTKSNPGIQVVSNTDDPDRRIGELKKNIASARGENNQPIYERFAPFANVPDEDIVFEVYVKTYVV